MAESFQSVTLNSSLFDDTTPSLPWGHGQSTPVNTPGFSPVVSPMQPSPTPIPGSPHAHSTGNNAFVAKRNAFVLGRINEKFTVGFENARRRITCPEQFIAFTKLVESVYMWCMLGKLYHENYEASVPTYEALCKCSTVLYCRGFLDENFMESMEFKLW